MKNSFLRSNNSVAMDDIVPALPFWHVEVKQAHSAFHVSPEKMVVDSQKNLYVLVDANDVTPTTVHLYKINEQGTLVWAMLLDSRYHDASQNIELFPNGDIIVHFSIVEMRFHYSVVVRFNSSGQVLWQKKIRLTASDSYATAISMSVHMNDVYIARTVSLYGTTVVTIHRLNSIGTLLSSYSFRYDNGNVALARIVVVSENFLYLSCTLNDTSTIVAGISNDTVVWQKVLPLNQLHRYYYSRLLLDSSYNVYIDFRTLDSIGILKFNQTGELLKSKAIGRRSYYDEILDIAIANDKLFVSVFCYDGMGIIRYNTDLVSDMQRVFPGIVGHGGCLTADESSMYLAAWWYGIHAFKLPINGSMSTRVASTIVAGRLNGYSYIQLNRSTGDIPLVELPSTLLIPEVLTAQSEDATAVLANVAIDPSIVLGRMYSVFGLNAPRAGNSLWLTPNNVMYQSGETNNKDIKMIKYSSTRATLWTRDLKQSPNTVRSECVCSDNEDNVIIVGSRRIVSTELFIIKCGPDGTTQWAKIIANGLTGSSGSFNRALTDSSNNIYAVGTFWPSSFYHMILNKFSSNGTLLWSKCLDVGGAKYIEGNALATDTSGNLYATGSRSGSSALNYGAVLAKFNSDGVLSWAKSFLKTGRQIKGTGISVGPTRITVTGSMFSVSSTNAPGNGFIFSFDLNGNLVWAREILESSNSNSVMEDANGNLYTTFDNVLLKFDQSGTLLYQKGLSPIGPLTLTSSSVIIGSGRESFEYYLSEIHNLVESNMVVLNDNTIVQDTSITFSAVDSSTLGLGALITDTNITNSVVSNATTLSNVKHGVTYVATPII